MKLRVWARLFYTIVSLAPLILLVIAVVALIFGHSTAQNYLLGQVESMIGPARIGSCEGNDRTCSKTLHQAR